MAAPKVLGIDAAIASVLLKPVGIFNLTFSQWKTHTQSRPTGFRESLIYQLVFLVAVCYYVIWFFDLMV